jgi:hypothetical protein
LRPNQPGKGANRSTNGDAAIMLTSAPGAEGSLTVNDSLHPNRAATVRVFTRREGTNETNGERHENPQTRPA